MIDHCEGCPLNTETRDHVPSYGPTGGFCVIGEAPGRTEVIQGQPFVGKSGQLLRATLKSEGIDPDEVYYMNAVGCQPPKTPTNKMIAQCNGWLRSELNEVRPEKILLVGGTALGSMMVGNKGMPITRWRGLGMWSKIDDRNIYTVPTFHPAAILRNPNLFRDFQYDIEKLARNDRPCDPPDVEEIRIESPDHFLEWTQVLRSASRLSCDLETTGLSATRNQIMSIGIGALTSDDKGISVIVPRELVFNDDIRLLLRNLIADWDGTMVFQNIKFDLQFLYMYFGEKICPRDPRDTMLMRYAQDERPGVGDDTGGTAYRTHGLKDMVRVRYDVPNYSFDFNSFFKTPEEERDWDSLYHYHSLDCYFTLRVDDDILQELHDESPRLIELVNDILVPGALAFADIELHGVLIDRPYLEKLQAQTEGELSELLESIQEVAQTYGLGDFNPQSWVQVRKLLFDEMKLPTKNRSTDKEALQALKLRINPERAEFVGNILLFRQKAKTKSTYIDGILKRLDDDGRVRTDIIMHGSATGRTASRNPNLQNIPVLIGPQIRRAFIVPDGYLMVEADYSQLELRIAAWYSRDPVLMKWYQEGRDVHRLVAADIFEKGEEDIVWLERYMAKYVDFGIIYGRGAKSLATGWEMEHFRELGGKVWSISEAQQYIDRLLGLWSGLNGWINLQHHRVKTHGFIETPMGRRRRFPLLSRDTVALMERQAVNTPIQSLAADLCSTAVIRLNQRLDPTWAHILFEVHDSIFFEVKENKLDELVEIARYEMEENVPIEKVIPFSIDIKAGKRWGELELVS